MPNTPTPMKDVANKVAFITGGSSGIGLGIARAFLDAGMKVAFSYRTEKHRDEAMAYLADAADRVHAIKVDVTDRPGLEKAAAETVDVFGKVHVLVNNAGVTLMADVGDTTYEDWDWIIDINLNGPFNGVRAFLPHIKAHGEGGHIVTTSSVLGLATSIHQAGYCVSKAANVAMMEALHGELLHTNIGVSVYCPGPVVTNIIDSKRGRADLSEQDIKDHAEKLKDGAQFMKKYPLPMTPLESGRRVLKGVQDNELYIVTHPEFNPRIRERTGAILASLATDIPPSDPRLAAAHEFQKLIYNI